MAPSWSRVRLGVVSKLHTEQLNPALSPNQLFQLFSLPAFDEGQVPHLELGSRIESQKLIVPPTAILVSKLNPRIPRVWEPRVSVDLPAIASTEFLVLVPQQGFDRRYLKYACLSPKVRSQMESLVTGTSGSHQRVHPEDFQDIEVDVPDTLAEQRAIAHILGVLDDKIELNRRMNETLEAMARALFKSWFIDFDPVHAKAEGRDPGLPADIAALFPDSFEDSDLGEIPKGWTAVPMGHLAEVTIGGDWGEDNPFANSIEAVCLRGVDLEHLRENGWADAPRRWFTTLSIQKRSLCVRNVLVAGSGAGPTGRSLWAAPEVDQLWGVPVVYSNFCKRLRCPSEASAIYLDRSLSIMRDSGEIWDFVNGTSVPNLDVGALLSGKMIVLPDGPILDAFAKLTKRVSARLFSPESHTLATVRDTLLPKLLSGEIRLDDITKTGGINDER